MRTLKGRPDFGMRGVKSGAVFQNLAHRRKQFHLARTVKVARIEAEAGQGAGHV